MKTTAKALSALALLWTSGCATGPQPSTDLDAGGDSPDAGAGTPFTLAKGWLQGYAIDSQGQEHALALDNGIAQYGFCAGQCTSAASWTWSPMPGLAGVTVRSGALALDSAGHPHVAWAVTQGSTAIGSTDIVYAECSTGCASPPSWSTVVLPSLSGLGAPWLAVDETGAVEVAFSEASDLAIAACVGNCSQSAQWSITRQALLPSIRSFAWAPGGVRAMTLQDSDNSFSYLECRQGCLSAANWPTGASRPVLSGLNALSVALTAQGEPRLAAGVQAAGTAPAAFGYFLCHGNCLLASSWSGVAFATNLLEPSVGAVGFDGAGHPYFSAGSTVGEDAEIHFCTTNCDTGTATWLHAVLETSGDLPSIPAQPPFTLSAWSLNPPLLALDAQGHLHALYEAFHQQAEGGTGGLVTTDQTWIRYAE